jgi:hypothetical protein
VTATGSITSSSDIAFKENIRPITGALDVVKEVGGDYFDWTDDFLSKHETPMRKADFGFIGQKMLKSFPLAVHRKEDGTILVDYQKLCAVSFAAINELTARIESLENKLKG